MNVATLYYFQTTARCGNITSAAKALGVQQPSLSVAIRRLEGELGTTLLRRERDGVTLTSTGKEFLHYVTEALALLDLAKQRIHGLEHDEVGSFVLGCPNALGAYFLPPFFAEFLPTAPHVTLSLWAGPSQTVQQAVLNRDIHFGLIANPVPHPDLVLVKLFYDATDIFVARQLQHGDQATHQSLDWEEACARLRAGPLVYVSYTARAAELLARLGDAQLLPASQLACGDVALAKSLAQAGIGVAILPRRIATDDREGTLQRLHPALPYLPDAIYLAYRADLHRTRAAIRLKDALVEQGRSLGSDAESQCIQQEIAERHSEPGVHTPSLGIQIGESDGSHA
jgi:DNA-binding transcriptional LysR family regulator